MFRPVLFCFPVDSLMASHAAGVTVSLGHEVLRWFYRMGVPGTKRGGQDEDGPRERGPSSGGTSAGAKAGAVGSPPAA